MKPYVLDLPPIYRGCDYEAIILRWKDRNGDPMPLGGWTPYCTTKRFNLNAKVRSTSEGITAISMTRFQTANLKLGMEEWDWVWLNNFTTQITPPHLAGRVEVKEPITPLTRPL